MKTLACRPKYELTDNRLRLDDGTIVRQIRACRNFAGVRAGELGGFVESEANLNQWDDSWISQETAVYGDICLSDRRRNSVVKELRYNLSAILTGIGTAIAAASICGFIYSMVVFYPW